MPRRLLPAPSGLHFLPRGFRLAALGFGLEQDLTPTMHLWNDYEGATLAGQWSLGRLLRTEGRSALFATTKPDGTPAVLRLTEALNDQSALHARYQAMKAAGDEFLVKVEGFGDAEWDGTPLSYAVLEPTQESLADILANRRLDPAELQEVSTVVAGGLLALHRQGLVHGLVEPESVLAAGDRIKLRSDCARPAPATPEDAQVEGAITERTDAWGLANIIHQALTQAPLQSEADALALPEPYATIVRQTARGAWGVPEIEGELKRATRGIAVPARPAAPAKPAVPAAVESVEVGSFNAPASQRSPVVPATKSPMAGAGLASGAAARAALPVEEPATVKQDRISGRASADGRGVESDAGELVSAIRRPAILALLAALVLIAILFMIFHRGAKPAPHARTVSQVTPAAAGSAVPEVSSGAGAMVRQPASSAEKPSSSASASTPVRPNAGVRDVWRVVAYTYNDRKNAEKKAAELNKKHPDFKAEVWSPTDARPYLVTLGGPMPRAEAMEMRTRALEAEVSKDVYAQNYSR